MRYFILILSLILTSTSLVSAQEQTPYDIALERILDAEASGAIRLDLSSLELTDIPPEIGNLTELEMLFLLNNQLSNLPPEIGNLTKLYFLNIGGNQFSNLPLEIGNLTNLRELYLGGNYLDEIPDEIYNLPNLFLLDLSNNSLDSLSSEINNLMNLRILNISNNELNTLPAEIGNLSNLCSLHIEGNPIQHLPTSLAKLSNLEAEGCVLSLSDNPLVSPPSEVIDQGTSAIFDYLENRALWHFQRLMVSALGGIGVIVLMILGLRYRQRGIRKPKQKRGE